MLLCRYSISFYLCSTWNFKKHFHIYHPMVSFSVCRSLSFPAKSFGKSAFLLPDFHQFISSTGRSLGLQEFRAWPRESYWTWPQWHQSFRKWRQLQAARPVSWPGHRQSCSQGDKHPSMTRSHHASFRKGSHVPRVSANCLLTNQPLNNLIVCFQNNSL